jgi:hypothetical protein
MTDRTDAIAAEIAENRQAAFSPRVPDLDALK